jgi:hypothetical protein
MQKMSFKQKNALNAIRWSLGGLCLIPIYCVVGMIFIILGVMWICIIVPIFCIAGKTGKKSSCASPRQQRSFK